MKYKSENQYDGFLDLEIKPDGIYIIVYAPSNGGRKVTLDLATIFLKSKGLKEYDFEAVKSAINSDNEKEIKKISNSNSLPPLDEEMVVEVSKNKMFLVIYFNEPQNNGKILSKDEIVDILNNQGIVYGVDYNGIDDVLANKKYKYKYLIARGVEAVNGKNGSLKFSFDVEKRNIKPKISEDGSVDFRNLNLIEIVKKGQILVTTIPPDEGTVGKNIYGVEIPNIKGKKATLPKGKNVIVSKDGQSLIADMDGQITYMDGKISIYSTYEVPANVDNSTGNIDFVGNVIIRGNVLTGFTIKAGGNIEVYGVVEGAELEADGDIILYRGMQGVNRGVLISKGSITAKYIENSSITARGSIQSNAIMHSDVKCGDSVLVEGKKGLLVGGIIRAGVEVSAKTIGSPMATTTEIEVGIDPEILEQYRNLKSDIEGVKNETQKMTQMIDTLTQIQKVGKMTPDKEQMLIKSLKAKTFLKNKLESIQNELDSLEPKVQERMDGRIKAFNVVYPGVKVSIGSVVAYIREERKFCCMVSDHVEIKFNSYS